MLINIKQMKALCLRRGHNTFNVRQFLGITKISALETNLMSIQLLTNTNWHCLNNYITRNNNRQVVVL